MSEDHEPDQQPAMTSPANQPHGGPLVSDQATWPPSPSRDSCRPSLAFQPQSEGAEPLDLKGWSSPGFYSLGLVFPATCLRKGTARRTLSGHKGLAVLPCALLGQGWGRGELWGGQWVGGGGRRELEEAREQGGYLGRFSEKGEWWREKEKR